jgi:hypothetical protein
MDLDKTIKLEYFTASGIVTDKPCWLMGIIVGVTDVTSGYLVLRDGSLSTAPIKSTLYGNYSGEPVVILNTPIFFKNGLYIEFASNITNVSVQYKHEKE